MEREIINVKKVVVEEVDITTKKGEEMTIEKYSLVVTSEKLGKDISIPVELSYETKQWVKNLDLLEVEK